LSDQVPDGPDRMPAVQLVLLRVASHGLPTSLPTQSPLTPAQWQLLLQEASRHRLLGLLVAAAASGNVALTDDQAADLRRIASVITAHSMQLQALLLTTVAALADRDVSPVVLKGFAAATLDYADPTWRQFGDLDLLVRPEEFDRAVAAMIALGYGRRGRPERRPGYDSRYAKDVTFLVPNGSSIDIHRTLVSGPLAERVDLRDCWAQQRCFELNGVSFRALSDTTRFLSLCFHAALGDHPIRLLSARDVCQGLVNPALDPQDVLERAGSWNCEVVVARAVTASSSALPVQLNTPLIDWAAKFRARPRDEALLDMYTGLQPPGPRRDWATVREMRGARRRLGFIAGAVFPSRYYLEGRYSGYVDYWRQQLSSLRQPSDVPPT